MINKKIFFYLWTLIACCIVLTSVILLLRGISIQTNILKLLPEAKQNPQLQHAIAQHSNIFSKNVAFLLGADDQNISQQASIKLAKQLEDSNLFKAVIARFDQQQIQDTYHLYKPYSRNLISNQDLQYINHDKSENIRQSLLTAMSSPTSTLNSTALEQDPLMFFTHFLLNSSPKLGHFQLQNQMLARHKNGKYYTLITARVKDDPFSIELQDKFMHLYKKLKTSITNEYTNATLLSTGMIHNVSAATKQAKLEISLIGSGSLLGIIILFLVCFRSLRPLFFSLVPIIVGIAAALVICAFVFQSIHIMTFVFGASLVGVSVDYSFHFFTEQHYHGNAVTSNNTLSNILPGITFGLLTSIIGYFAFFFAPLPGLQQMALFSSVGIITAYCCVLFWFPYLPIKREKQICHLCKIFSERFLSLWAWHKTLRFPVIPGILIGICIIGFTKVSINDDIRLLNSTPPQIEQDQLTFERITGINPASQFFMVNGPSPNAVLETEEALVAKLNHLVKNDALGSFSAISTSIPSINRQQQNYATLRNKLLKDDSLVNMMLDIGYNPAVIKTYQEKYKNPTTEILTFDLWKQSVAFRSQQWLEPEPHKYISIIHLFSIKDLTQLYDVATTLDKVIFVDRVSDISQLFSEHRLQANKLVIAAYLIVLLILIWRYGIKLGLLVLIPPLLAGLTAIAATGFMSQPLTLFNTLALILVLGIGIDYTLFFAENRSERAPIMLAIGLSAITTILSFGLLALSSTPALNSIGITVFFGILVSLLMAPIVNNNINKSRNKKHI